MGYSFLSAPLLALLLLGAGAPREAKLVGDPLPPAVLGWKPQGEERAYDRTTVYDYMDGGAEVYLAYGLTRLRVAVYARPGEPSITVNLFEMDSEAGAYGAFTFEREDEGVPVGQGGEYGGGLLRFWQGRTFALLQADRETPGVREAVLALGKGAAAGLGPPGKAPRLPSALPSDGLRPLTVRYALSPLLLETLERQAWGNPLGLGPRCEAALGRYGRVGNPERVLIARFPDAAGASAGASAFLKAKGPDKAIPGQPFNGAAGWSAAAASGSFVVLVLDAPDAAGAKRRLEEASRKLEEVAP